MFDLTGKFALVTGATGGIGGAIATALHAQGATVGLSGTREAVLQELAAKLGSRVHLLPCNLADAEAVNSLIGQAEAAMGQVDILVNNAGITRDTLLPRMSDEQWDEVIATNLRGVFLLSRAASRTMMSQRSGRIINLSSVSGIRGNKGQTNYSASKAGVIGFTQSLALELAGRNVTVNAVAPGFIETDMTAALGELGKEEAKKRIPCKQLGQPEDIAEAVVFLASGAARYITGQVLTIDGGMTV